ncbi:hypothetical protein QJS10_CPA10g01738 [Acorus calamus]|uniref:Uncharacterized protein n=1 Tax=Acorus calamus TaxID=4465 RepID=A0AAV9DYK7_ACOCL|nr:hypothetical protein QJS10_CPA10g01738 [Acorus calamus]
MEDEKLAAYYDELSRKGEGAAKFKRGLGFSSSSDSLSKPSPSSSSPFLSNFVRASSPANAKPSSDHPDKKVQIESIHNKLNKDHHRLPPSRADGDRRSRRRDHRSRSRSRSPSSRRRSRSRSPGRSSRRDSDRRRGERSSRDGKSGGGGGGGVDYSKLIEGYSQMTPAERVKAKMKHQLSRTDILLIQQLATKE